MSRPPGKHDRLGRKENKLTEKKRVCLKCRHLFMSTWVGNRICPNCAPEVDKLQRSSIFTRSAITTQTRVRKRSSI